MNEKNPQAAADPAPDNQAEAAARALQDRIIAAQAGLAAPGAAGAGLAGPGAGKAATARPDLGSAGPAGEGVSDVAELARLIGLIRQNEAHSGDAARSIVIGEFSVLAHRVPDALIGPLQTLSRNEAAVLRFLGWGRSNNDIGMLLNCNEATVRSHMNNAIRKLDLDGMRELNSLAGLLFHPVD